MTAFYFGICEHKAGDLRVRACYLLLWRRGNKGYNLCLDSRGSLNKDADRNFISIFQKSHDPWMDKWRESRFEVIFHQVSAWTINPFNVAEVFEMRWDGNEMKDDKGFRSGFGSVIYILRVLARYTWSFIAWRQSFPRKTHTEKGEAKTKTNDAVLRPFPILCRPSMSVLYCSRCNSSDFSAYESASNGGFDEIVCSGLDCLDTREYR